MHERHRSFLEKIIFKTICKDEGKSCFSLIVNIDSNEVIKKLNLKCIPHPSAYKVSYKQKGHKKISKKNIKNNLRAISNCFLDWELLWGGYLWYKVSYKQKGHQK